MHDLGSCVFETAMKPLEAFRLTERRRGLLRSARGRVLEVGAGTGANLPFFRFSDIEEVVLTDRDLTPVIRRRARKLRRHAADAGARLTLVEAAVERLPFPAGSFDCVVATLVFCTVRDQEAALAEVRRVLRPGGLLLFIEHVRPPQPALARLFGLVNPAWGLLAGGCNLTRDTLGALRGIGLPPAKVGRFGRGIFTHGVATAGPVLCGSPGSFSTRGRAPATESAESIRRAGRHRQR